MIPLDPLHATPEPYAVYVPFSAPSSCVEEMGQVEQQVTVSAFPSFRVR